MSPRERIVITTTLLLFTLAFSLEAQTMRGQVLDSITSEPIRGAELVVITQSGDTVEVAKTNTEGRFAISVPFGDYTIRCRCIGHKQKEARVEFTEDRLLTIRLAPVTVAP
jgi:hypothetical protein